MLCCCFTLLWFHFILLSLSCFDDWVKAAVFIRLLQHLRQWSSILVLEDPCPARFSCFLLFSKSKFCRSLSITFISGESNPNQTETTATEGPDPCSKVCLLVLSSNSKLQINPVVSVRNMSHTKVKGQSTGSTVQGKSNNFYWFSHFNPHLI